MPSCPCSTRKTLLKHPGSALEIYDMQRKHEQGTNLSIAISKKDQLQVGRIVGILQIEINSTACGCDINALP